MPGSRRVLLLAAAALATASCGAVTSLPEETTAVDDDREAWAILAATNRSGEVRTDEVGWRDVRCAPLGDGWYEVSFGRDGFSGNFEFGHYDGPGEFPTPPITRGLRPPCDACSFVSFTVGGQFFESPRGFACTVTASIVDAWMQASVTCEGTDRDRMRWVAIDAELECPIVEP